MAVAPATPHRPTRAEAPALAPIAARGSASAAGSVFGAGSEPGAGSPAPLGPAVAAALLAGVLIVQVWASLPSAPLIAALAAAGLAAWFRGGRLRPGGAFLVGIALACGHGRAAMEVRLPPALAGRELWIEGQVVGLPQVDDGQLRFGFRIERGDGEAAGLAGRRLRLTWYVPASAPMPELAAGSRWRLPVRLRRPRGLLNPGNSDFERRALEQRLAATGHVVATQVAARLADGEGLDALRERLARQVVAAVPTSSSRFVTALALGDTRALTDADWQVLRATGLTHLIAISGFHVGLVGGFGALLARGLWRLLPTLGRQWPRPQAAAAGALLFAAAYAALAGFALPTVRTLLMIAAVAGASLLRRHARAADGLAFALVAILVVDPPSVLAPGFWLSFAGVAWLLWCMPGPAVGGFGLWRPFLQSQAIAVLGLLPLTAWFFGQASLSGPVVNLVGIPWISLVVVPLCLLGLAAAPFSDVVAGGAWTLAAHLMQLLWTGLERIAAWPASLVWLPEPTAPTLLLALAGVFWCLLPRGVPGKALACLLVLPLLWPADRRPSPGEVDLWLLDAGQGLSLLVRTSGHDLLYDAGPGSRGSEGDGAIVPALHALGVRRLERLVLSHGDSDHAGGADAIRRAFAGTAILAPPGWAQPPMGECLAGRRWSHDGVHFTFLHPPTYFPYQRNESSCVLRIDAAGASVLLAGDIGRHVEARLAKLAPAAIRADVLLVPHHGSAGSSSLDFLAAVRPGLALLAVGADNRFGLPKAQVLARYARYSATVVDTAGSGAIRVHLDHNGAHLRERLRLDRRRYWRDAASAPTGYASEVPEFRR